jgi:PDZ domain-containing secreted protein
MISRFFQNFRGKSQVSISLLVKCDSQLTVDVIPYNNRNDGGPAAGLLSLVEVPEKA